MRTTLLALTPVLALLACGPASAPDPATDETTTAISDSGSLHLSLTGNPSPLVVGNNEVDFLVTDSAGGPVDGLVVTVQPFMPAMDHGTASTTVVPMGGGRYRVEGIYTFMPGRWILETTFAGPVHDHATPFFEIQ
jgi:hypothetical protein